MGLPTTMRAARLHKTGEPLSLDAIPLPKIRSTELLVNIKAAGYCHTDYEIAEGRLPGHRNLPFTGSHEPAGVVAAVGDQVKDFKVGDRVAGLWIEMCGKCGYCQRTDYIRCESNRGGGVDVDGAMAEYMRLDQRGAFHVPDSMPFEKACVLVCAGSTVYGAIKTAKAPKGGVVAILGLGGLGHLGIQFLKCMGYKVVAIDARKTPIDLVKQDIPARLQPDVLLQLDKSQDQVQQVLKATQHLGGIDAVINCNDVIASAVLGMDILKRHGTFVMVGGPDEAIPVNCDKLIHGDITVKGNLVCTMNDVHEMAKLVHDNQVEIVVKTWPLEQVNEMVKEYTSDRLRGRFVLLV